MLDAVVGIVVGILVVAGILVMIGPDVSKLTGRLSRFKARPSLPSPFQSRGAGQAPPSGLNPKTQRVLVGAARLATWLRSNGHDDLARELRAGAAQMTANEPAGLYALQAAVRKVRAVQRSEAGAQERLQSLAGELTKALRDRFEQLELLPFGR
ncbi:MAG: hypothetical protein ACHQ0J_00260 [Candidatus Dormibacterales bacterium]